MNRKDMLSVIDLIDRIEAAILAYKLTHNGRSPFAVSLNEIDYALYELYAYTLDFIRLRNKTQLFELSEIPEGVLNKIDIAPVTEREDL